ncbi:uncharacterized protein TM35_000441270 [Trypanosoma theileri]|uniref:Uncharacterized protein n=1 Tax=Trypanosoma theileri TaxID=67003 RepID=A0A1X0NIQ3_9TRYP|nr:uncharacterized protein TM35_000441270 [Trypanosoma theileri]ORC84471.1 hypothetical protein TM35_000441270 [Trypanosoma theileri]
MDGLAVTSSHHLYDSNSSSSDMESTASEMTPIDSLASSDDIQEIDFELQETLILPQQHNKVAVSPTRETEPCIVYLRLDDNMVQKDTSGICTDTPLIHEIFSSTLPALNHDGRSSSADGTDHFDKHFLHDSVEEISSIVSVEEKEPLNETAATARALTIRHSSAALLNAYFHLKRTVKQRTYRLYYVKWIQFLMRRCFLSASTQTATEDAPHNLGLVESSLKSDVSTKHGNDLFTPPPCLRKSPFRDNFESNKNPTEGNSLYYQNRKYKPQKPLSSSTTGSTFMSMNNKNKSNNNNNNNTTPDNSIIIKSPNSLLYSRLRSRSKPCILLDYGELSLPPNRGVAQSDYVPSTKLPKLITFPENVTVLSSSTVYINRSPFLNRK